MQIDGEKQSYSRSHLTPLRFNAAKFFVAVISLRSAFFRSSSIFLSFCGFNLLSRCHSISIFVFFFSSTQFTIYVLMKWSFHHFDWGHTLTQSQTFRRQTSIIIFHSSFTFYRQNDWRNLCKLHFQVYTKFDILFGLNVEMPRTQAHLSRWMFEHITNWPGDGWTCFPFDVTNETKRRSSSMLFTSHNISPRK